MIPRQFPLKFLAATCLAAAMAIGGPAANTVKAQSPEPTFLGFELGEEVRYVLERADGERRGMLNLWSMSLEEISDGEGVFDFLYQVGMYGSGGQGDRLLAHNEGRAWINAYGFPTRVQYTAQKQTPMGGLQYTINYRLEEGEERYRKHLEGREKDQEVNIDDARIDLSAPSGMYLFMPVDGDCIAAIRELRAATVESGAQSGGGQGGQGQTGSSQNSGGFFPNRSDPNALTRADFEPPCKGREPLFANPGLLNLTMPALWEAGTGSLEFATMAPTGVIARVVMGMAGGGGNSSGISVGGFNLLPDSGPDPFTEAQFAFDRFSINADGDLMQIEVGGRQVDVWKLATAPPVEAVYVDGDGSIVRLDLTPDPDTGDRYWIRRLRPSEY